MHAYAIFYFELKKKKKKTHLRYIVVPMKNIVNKFWNILQTLSDEDSFKSCCSVKEANQKIKELVKSLMIRFV